MVVAVEAAMNHKRRRAARRRAGCKLCKPWKLNGAKQDDVVTLRERDAARHGDGYQPGDPLVR